MLSTPRMILLKVLIKCFIFQDGQRHIGVALALLNPSSQSADLPHGEASRWAAAAALPAVWSARPAARRTARARSHRAIRLGPAF